MTENHDGNRSIWRFFDGAVSISISMLVAVLVADCALCGQLPALSWLKGLTEREDGIIIVATLLLFPTTAALYGGSKVFFAAKEAVEKKARAKGQGRRQSGRSKGRARAHPARVGGPGYAAYPRTGRRLDPRLRIIRPADVEPS